MTAKKKLVGVASSAAKPGVNVRNLMRQLERKEAAENLADLGLPPGAGADAVPTKRLPARRRPKLKEGSMEELGDEFDALTPNAKRAERMKGDKSKYAPYIKRLRERDEVPADMDPEDVVARLKARKVDSESPDMKAGGLTRDQKKTIKERSKLAKKRSRDAQKKRRKSIASTTPKIRGTTMTVAKGGVVSHTDYRKGGLFYKGKK